MRPSVGRSERKIVERYACDALTLVSAWFACVDISKALNDGRDSVDLWRKDAIIYVSALNECSEDF